MGLAYIQRGYTSLWRADHHLSRAIAVDGSNPRQYHWRGIARLRLGDYPAATADFEVVLRETPDSATTLRALGAALLRMGAPGPAAAALRQAADLEPELLETRWNLMVAAARAGDDPDALPERYRFDIPDRDAASPFRFEEVSAEIGIERWSRARGSGWADYDGDDDLDLVALGIRDPHALYRNRLVEDGATTFAPASLDTALFDPRGGWSALFSTTTGTAIPTSTSRGTAGTVRTRTVSIETTAAASWTWPPPPGSRVRRTGSRRRLPT